MPGRQRPDTMTPMVQRRTGPWALLALLGGCSCPGTSKPGVVESAVTAPARGSGRAPGQRFADFSGASGPRRARGGARGGATTGTPDPSDRASSLNPPAREPGKPRAESAALLRRTAREARVFVDVLLSGGIDRREVCSMADIRGHRLFRGRYFGQARAWFDAALRTDPTFEPALFNAARAAAAAGDPGAARRHLKTLRRLDTPLARSRLQLAEQDPDLAGLSRP